MMNAFGSTTFLRHMTNDLWLLLLAVWSLTAFGTKATQKSQSGGSRLAQTAVMGVGLYLLFAKFIAVGWLNERMFAVTPEIAMWGVAVTFAGVGFSVLARLTLGRNWSGVVTLKQDHTLVRRGPYRLVRHPIYTGMLVALSGSAMEYGLVRSLLAVAICGLAFWLKLSKEEEFMTERFGGEYVRYRREVSALVPFIL